MRQDDDRQRALALAEEGAKRAAAHADQETPSWQEHALAFLIRLSRERYDWTAEELRAYAAAHGLPEPPDRRAWGAIIKTAARRGLARKVPGMQRNGGVTCHARPQQVWRAAA